MKYLKKYKIFESYTSDILSNRDIIINALSEYVDLYKDGLVDQLEDIGFNTEASDEIEQLLNNGLPINKDIITIIVDDVSNSNNQRDASKLLDIYYECNYNLNQNNNDIVDNLKDIFSDFIDDKKAIFYKSNDKNDNRYVIEIKQEDILLSIDFQEIMNRVKSFINLDHMDYSGNNNYIKFEFYESYPDED